jgi:hypothetical protein
MRWVARVLGFRRKPKDRRKSPRSPGGDLIAHYWTGGAPTPRRVSDVSVDGAFIEGPEKWYPGTVVTLILQLGSAGGRLSPYTIRAAVVRSARDGFGVQFLFADRDERAEFQKFLQHAVDGPSGVTSSASNVPGAPTAGHGE